MDGEQIFVDNLQTALVETGAFSEVTLAGLPEDFGSGASELTMAAIDPGSTRLMTGWDSSFGGDLDYLCQILVTVLSRHEDPILCDKQARFLIANVKACVNGKMLSPGFAKPQKTLVTGQNWQKRTPPERRVALTVTYGYIETWSPPVESPPAL